MQKEGTLRKYEVSSPPSLPSGVQSVWSLSLVQWCAECLLPVIDIVVCRVFVPCH